MEGVIFEDGDSAFIEGGTSEFNDSWFWLDAFRNSTLNVTYADAWQKGDITEDLGRLFYPCAFYG